jgi:hypothetical protein
MLAIRSRTAVVAVTASLMLVVCGSVLVPPQSSAQTHASKPAQTHA